MLNAPTFACAGIASSHNAPGTTQRWRPRLGFGQVPIGASGCGMPENPAMLSTMPHNMLAEFAIIYVKRGDDFAPPYVALTTNRAQAESAALRWAESTFGDGTYRAVGGEIVRRMQGERWGETIR